MGLIANARFGTAANHAAVEDIGTYSSMERRYSTHKNTQQVLPAGYASFMGEDGAICTNFGIKALECSELPEIINRVFSLLCFLLGAVYCCTGSHVLYAEGKTRTNTTTVIQSDGYETLITSVGAGRVSDERRVPVDGDSRV